MKKVSKSVLKAKMFEYFRDLEKSGQELIVTDFGKPVLRIIPYREKRSVSELFRDVQSKVKLSRAALTESTESEWDLDTK